MAPSVKTKRVGKTTARVPEGLNDELLLRERAAPIRVQHLLIQLAAELALHHIGEDIAGLLKVLRPAVEDAGHYQRVLETQVRAEGPRPQLFEIGVVRYRVAVLHELEDLSHGGLTLYVSVKHLRATIAGDLDQP